MAVDSDSGQLVLFPSCILTWSLNLVAGAGITLKTRRATKHLIVFITGTAAACLVTGRIVVVIFANPPPLSGARSHSQGLLW